MSAEGSGQYLSDGIFKKGEFPVRVIVALGRNHTVLPINSHPEFEFHLVRHGRSQYFIDGVNYPCAKNSILIMHEREAHAWLCEESDSDKNICMVFDPIILEDRPISQAILKELAAVHHLTLSDEDANLAEFLLNEISDECKRGDLQWKEIVAEYMEAFLTIASRAAESAVADTSKRDSVVQEIIDYLEARYADKISLVELSKRFKLSQYALSKRFKQNIGLGFREYLIHRRIVAAQKLLEETDLKVSAIADKVGFDSLTTFNRDFRLLTGITPAVYRTMLHPHDPRS